MNYLPVSHSDSTDPYVYLYAGRKVSHTELFMSVRHVFISILCPQILLPNSNILQQQNFKK